MTHDESTNTPPWGWGTTQWPDEEDRRAAWRRHCEREGSCFPAMERPADRARRIGLLLARES